MKQKRQKTKKRENIDEEKLAIEYFDVVPFMKEKQRRKKTKERDKNKEPKESKKERQEGRNKEKKKERDKERETEKEGGQKRLREKERETLKINKKLPFLGGKQGFFLVLKTKNKKQNNKTTKTNKEGLGPSEVALRATSPDP